MTNDTAASGRSTAEPAAQRSETTGNTRTVPAPSRGTVPEPSAPAPIESFNPGGTDVDPRPQAETAATGEDRSGAVAGGAVAGGAVAGGAVATAGKVAGGPPDAPDGGDPARPGRVMIGVLAALAVSWLAAMLWVAHASISSGVGAVALATAASSLPPVVSAALVAGAASALLLADLAGGRRTAGWLGGPAGARFTVAVGAGALTGLVAGAAFVAGSGTDPARMALAGTLAAGACVGGLAAGLGGPRVVQAVVAAALAVFATGFILGLVKGPVQDFYGADGGEAARLSAAGWFAATSAVASGLAAGATAYRLLGGFRRSPYLRWPVYLAAGAGPGFLLLVTELIVRTGGARLLGLVREISDADRAVQAWTGGSRTNNALVVLFVGAIVTLIAFGRTLGSPATGEDDPGLPGQG